MKASQKFSHTIAAIILACSTCHADSEFQKIYNDRHSQADEQSATVNTIDYFSGVQETTDQQDELSADLQELIQQETNQKVIEFLSQAEELMSQSTDLLESQTTGQSSIVINNEVIERLYNAAKQKSQSPGQSKEQNDALMQMMQRMMEEAFDDKEAQGNAQQSSGDGEGANGSSTQTLGNATSENTKQRRISRKSGTILKNIPREFQEIIESYNREISK